MLSPGLRSYICSVRARLRHHSSGCSDWRQQQGGKGGSHCDNGLAGASFAQSSDATDILGVAASFSGAIETYVCHYGHGPANTQPMMLSGQGGPPAIVRRPLMKLTKAKPRILDTFCANGDYVNTALIPASFAIWSPPPSHVQE